MRKVCTIQHSSSSEELLSHRHGEPEVDNATDVAAEDSALVFNRGGACSADAMSAADAVSSPDDCQQRQRLPLALEGKWFSLLSQQKFSMDEVRLHDRPDDCWFVAEGVVYDATPFVRLHPGGPCIGRRAGQDATRDFGFHSRAARKSWGEFQIGRLETERTCSLM